jgi:hypothetical protein
LPPFLTTKESLVTHFCGWRVVWITQFRLVPVRRVSDAGEVSRVLAVVTLITWLFTAGIGAFMLRTVITLGGLRRQRARSGSLPPAVLFAHFGLALTGLIVWAGYVVTARVVLAWSAVGLLMPAIGLGVSTVTLWTPFPDLHSAPKVHPLTGAHGTGPAGGMLASPAEDVLTRKLTDEVLASAVSDEVLIRKLTEEVVASVRADPSRVRAKTKGHLAALIPVGHGMSAIITFLLAVITAAGAT